MSGLLQTSKVSRISNSDKKISLGMVTSLTSPCSLLGSDALCSCHVLLVLLLCVYVIVYVHVYVYVYVHVYAQY